MAERLEERGSPNAPYVESPDPDQLVALSANKRSSRIWYVPTRLKGANVDGADFDYVGYTVDLLVDKALSRRRKGDILVAKGTMIIVDNIRAVLQNGTDNGSDRVETRSITRRRNLPDVEAWQDLAPHQFPGLIVYDWDTLSRIGLGLNGATRRLLGRSEEAIKTIYLTDRLAISPDFAIPTPVHSH